MDEKLRGWRSIQLVALFFVVATCGAESCFAEWTFVRGDVNGDSLVDLGDPVAALSFLFAGTTVPCLDALDSDDDGALSLADPVYTLSYLFAGGPLLPAPLSQCGLDPTPDALDCEGPLTGCSAAMPPNIVVIIADDFGVDLVSAYGEGADPPCTPNLDLLATSGLLFRNAWSLPICSPTRAAVQTGRFGFRTGIGTVVMGGPGLALAETTLPEMLAGYSSACLGKWHISGTLGNMHPLASGFDHHAGTLQGGLPDYLSWTKFTNGQPSPTTTYATTDTTDDAIDAVLNMTPPFYVQVAYNAPHTPNHAPPVSLCPTTSCPSSWCDNLPTTPSAAEFVKAMTEALDSEVGRLLQVIDSLPNTWIFFMGDNGTQRQASEAPFIPMHGKGTVYEGGINVPFIVRGPGIATGECAGLVSVTDLFATFGELAGVSASAEDSVSMVPYFSDPTTTVRTTVYSERFTPNHQSLPFADHDRAVRNSRYKLIRRTGAPDEFYDLLIDPFEVDDLLSPAGSTLNSAEQAAYNALVTELTTLGVQ